MISWADFCKAVESAGLQPRQCSGGHWRIEGGQFQVNYYPTTQTIYVNGMTRVKGQPRMQGPVEAAIRYAWGGLTIGVRPKDAQAARKKYTKRKRAMFRRQKLCWWCNRPLTLETATVDHVIPLSRGGSNGTDNTVLACWPCNKARGNELGPPPPAAQEVLPGPCAFGCHVSGGNALVCPAERNQGSCECPCHQGAWA